MAKIHEAGPELRTATFRMQVAVFHTVVYALASGLVNPFDKRMLAV